MQEYTEIFPEDMEQEQAQPEPEPGPKFTTIEQARALLAEKHKVIVDDQDGLLLMVTLHNAFLTDYHTLLTAHDEELQTKQDQASADLEKKSDALLKTVKITLEHFVSENLSPLIAQIEEIQKEQQKPAQSQGMTPLSLGLLGLCCVCVLLLTLKITGIL